MKEFVGQTGSTRNLGSKAKILFGPISVPFGVNKICQEFYLIQNTLCYNFGPERYRDEGL